MPRLGTVTIVVRNYDEAIRWFVDALDFEVLDDIALAPGKRWVRVAPKGGNGGTALLLAEAVGAAQEHAIGNQTGGRVFLFLETDDFARDHAAFVARGVHFREAPRHEPYGTVAVFEDLYGNGWDLIEHRRLD